MLSNGYTYTARSPSLQQLKYSGKFLNRANFRMFRAQAKCAKIRTCEISSRCTHIRSAMALYWYLKPLRRSGCPYKYVAAYHRLNGERSMRH